MSELAGHLIGVIIVLMMLVFIGIWIWAWLPHHKSVFSDLARLPLDERGARAMSGFWSTWVMVLACVTAGLSLFLFVWGITMRIPTQPTAPRGHVWAHGVLREGVRPLPLWWVVMSLGAFLFGAVYLFRYPGFGNFAGKLGWTSHGEQQRDARRQRRAARGAPRVLAQPRRRAARGESERGQHRPSPLSRQLRRLPRHRRPWQSRGRCADLTDADWLYGGDGETILKSILDGRNGMMPPQGPALGHNGTNAVASYVVSRSGTIAPPGPGRGRQGDFDTLCAACHGVDGRGNPALGAPNLFDNVWLYGGDIASVVATVRDGRSGVMPAWRARLTDDEARLIAAWVIAQGSARVAAR